jgi:hypothetical protein
VRLQELRVQRRFGYIPNAMSINTRQALELLNQALASGARSPEEVKRFLLSPAEHRTSFGPLRFDADGDHQVAFQVFTAAEDQVP